MNNITVSVIIPVYNTEKYLEECLKSVINQTLKEIEIICIDDGSTDNSPDILKEYSEKDGRIEFIPRLTKVRVLPEIEESIWQKESMSISLIQMTL